MQDDKAIFGLPAAGAALGNLQASAAQLPTVAGGGRLDRRAKAAIVVRLLLNEGADIPLEELPDDLQAALTKQMGRMKLVDRETLASVVEEFADEVERVGLHFPNGLAGALTALDGKISPQTAARLRKEAGVRQTGDPWTRLVAIPTEALVAVAEAESTEVAAVLLSKLPTAKAAELLAMLPGPLARRITYAVSQTEAVTPEAVDRIGLSLAAQLEDKPLQAFTDPPNSRVGAILNQSSSRTRDDMLDGLDETDKDFAEKVRKEIFTFAHITIRVFPKDVPAIVREIDGDTFVVALAGATDDYTRGVAEFLLANMSQRMADNLKDEIADKGKVKPKDAEAAMNEIVAVIRRMETEGTIELKTQEEIEEDQQEE